MQVCKLCSRLAVSSFCGPLTGYQTFQELAKVAEAQQHQPRFSPPVLAASRQPPSRASLLQPRCTSLLVSCHQKPTSPKFYACHCLSALAATDRPRLLFPIPCSAPVKIFMLPPISPTSTPHADAAPNRPPPTDSLTHGLVELNVRSLRYAHATTPKAMTRK